MAKNQITMTKISTSNKVSLIRGPDYNKTINEYTFSGKGVSQTRHMTEYQAKQHKSILEGQDE